MEIGNIDDPNVEELSGGNTQGLLVEIPDELKEAPEDIKAIYVKWIECERAIDNHPRRHFQFINMITKDLEMVNALTFPGWAEKRAKQKNISDTDLKILKELVQEMDQLKFQKSRLNRQWKKWLIPYIGRNVLDWRKAELIDMYAHFANHEEVRTKVEEWGYRAHIDNIYKFFLNNKEIIEKKRTEFIRTARDHYLATDAGRMETLSMLHTRFVGMFNEQYGQISPNQSKLIELAREIRGIIEQARKEIKGEEIRLTVDGKIDINASIQASQTIQEISKKMPINIIPIYLVAAKMGINPNGILTSLVNSFYKDFNGFQALKAGGQPPTTMDIIRNYDWNAIQTYHLNKPVEQVGTIVEYEEMPFTEVQKVKTKREKLQNIIDEQLKDKDSNP